MILLKEMKKQNKTKLQGPEGQNGRRNTHGIGVAEGKEKVIGGEKVLEDMRAEEFPNLVKDTDLQISRSSVNAKQDKFKENHVQTPSKTQKTKGKDGGRGH